MIGGQTKAFGAAMYRLRVSDFTSVEMEGGVSPAGRSLRRPGALLLPGGDALQGPRVVNHDATEPHRSAPWPHDPIPHQGPVRELVERVTERAGHPVSHIPRAVDYDPANGGKCVLCRHCDAYYCPRDAKMDAEIAALRPRSRPARSRC